MNRDPKSEDEMKAKAVRKLVRTVIQENGGDGKDVKKRIDTNYPKGIVWFKDARIAEWKDGRMVFKDAGKDFKEAFEKLMGQE